MATATSDQIMVAGTEVGRRMPRPALDGVKRITQRREVIHRSAPDYCCRQIVARGQVHPKAITPDLASVAKAGYVMTRITMR
jgi:hypothetical protein